MEKKVHYGEYSLRHWIDLMISGDIELPPYQRCFVWNEAAVKNFISSLKDDGFVPPVTIGVCSFENEIKNFILDGQQRLSSLLLAYFKVFPKKDAFKRNETSDLADGSAEEDDDLTEEIIDWKFELLTAGKKKIEEIRSSISLEQYNIVDYNTKKENEDDEDFFNNNYLGFSFIVPSVDDATSQQKFYSSLFRNINLQGVSLEPIESRKSLYFLNKNFVDFFEPECCKNIKIKLTAKTQYFDFTRAMALLSNYKKDGRETNIAKGYKPMMERFYERYIFATVNDSEDRFFVKYSNVFPDNNYRGLMDNLKEHINNLGFQRFEFSSIIDADIYMLGLLYSVLYKAKNIDLSRKDELLAKLTLKVEAIKRDSPAHKAAPSLFKYLRARIAESIQIYSRYEL